MGADDGEHEQMAGSGGGGAGMHVRDVVRVVVGSDGVADTERDLPNRD